jgi:hypothetical protein
LSSHAAMYSFNSCVHVLVITIIVMACIQRGACYNMCVLQYMLQYIHISRVQQISTVKTLSQTVTMCACGPSDTPGFTMGTSWALSASILSSRAAMYCFHLCVHALVITIIVMACIQGAACSVNTNTCTYQRFNRFQRLRLLSQTLCERVSPVTHLASP